MVKHANKKIWINYAVGSVKMENEATRDGFGKGIVKAGENKNVVVLDADLAESTRSRKFGEKYPKRFFEMGIAEMDMLGTAGGLAASGKIPFAWKMTTAISSTMDK